MSSLVVNTNVAAINAYNNLNATDTAMSKAISQLSCQVCRFRAPQTTRLATWSLKTCFPSRTATSKRCRTLRTASR